MAAQSPAITQRFFDEIFTDIVRRLPQHGTETDRLQKSVREALVRMEQQKSLCRTLFHDSEGLFSTQLLDKIREVATAENGPADAHRNLRISYMCGGILRVVLDWLRNDCRPERETVAQVIEHGVHRAFR